MKKISILIKESYGRPTILLYSKSKEDSQLIADCMSERYSSFSMWSEEASPGEAGEQAVEQAVVVGRKRFPVRIIS